MKVAQGLGTPQEEGAHQQCSQYMSVCQGGSGESHKPHLQRGCVQVYGPQEGFLRRAHGAPEPGLWGQVPLSAHGAQDPLGEMSQDSKFSVVMKGLDIILRVLGSHRGFLSREDTDGVQTGTRCNDINCQLISRAGTT